MKTTTSIIMQRIILAFYLLSFPFFSFGQSASWTAYKPDFFPTNASGQIHGISRVSQMKFHPSNSQKMYAVSARGGLFISTNGGSNWSIAPGSDNLTLGTRFASVCIDHTDDQVIYLGGGDHNYYSSGSGVFKSTNGGQTFVSSGLGGKIIVDMIMDPSNRNTIVAATNTGIYKTTDAGTTWVLKSASIALDDLQAKPGTGIRVLYASSRGAELYRSLDGGDTWSQITSGIYIPTGYTSGGGTRVAVTPADSNIVYFFMNAKGGTLFKSTDGGSNFTAVKDNLSPFLTGYTNSSADPGQGDYNTGLGVDRVNPNIVYFVAHVVWKSTDGGVTWTQLTNWYQKVHTDMHQTINSPYNNNQLWNMNDGGVWLSTDGGNNWVQKSDGIFGYEIYHGGTSPTRRDVVSIGTQDNGELYATSSGWFTNRGGDWQSHCVFDYRPNSSMVYYFLPDWGTVQIPRRRLVTGSAVTYGLPSYVTDFSDICYHRSNPDLGFVGDTVVLRSTNLTATTPAWTSIFNTGVKIISMHSNFADPNRLYVLTSNGKMIVSSDALSAAPTFTTYSLPITSVSTGGITSIKSSPDVVYLVANTNAYRSTDNGATWTSVKYNLPNYNHAAIIADEFFSTSELVFVATGGSVYYKTASGTSWTPYSTGLPSRTTIVDMSIFNDSTSNTLLRTFTYGRGVWETPITSLRALSVNFSASTTNTCVGKPIVFSDLSTGNVTSRTWSFPGGTPSTSTAANPTVTYAAPGVYSVTLTVSNGSTSSTLTKTNYISTQGLSLPITEDFESGVFAPGNWTNVDAGNNAIAWQQYNGVGGFGNSNGCMFFDNYSSDAQGARDEFRSTSLNLSGLGTAQLVFDLAYQPYSLSSYIDSLRILVSTDCGTTFNPIYTKWGSSLATVTGTNTAEFVPTGTQWRTDTVNLSAYAGQQIQVSFQNIGRYGNNLYIDNIRLQGSSGCNATLALNQTNTRCIGQSTGSINAVMSGGNGSVTYTIAPGGTSNSTGVFTGLSAGNYTVSAVDANQCSVSGTVSIGYQYTVNATASNTNIQCFGNTSTVSVNGSGGVSPYTGAGTFTVSAGNYTYTITDANGCQASTSISISQPVQLIATSTNTVINCFGGTSVVTVNATGGTSPYTGAGTFTVTAGIYTYTVTDANGCTATTNRIIQQPSQLVASSSAGSISCFGGSTTVSVTASGGTSPYTGIGNFPVSAGSSSFTVTDQNGCTANTSITVNQPTDLNISAAASAITCFGGQSTVTVSASGGTPPYSGTGSFTRSAGTQSFTVSDANGCSKTISITISQPAALSPTIIVTGPTTFCAGGSVVLTAPSGYSAYSWSNGSTSSSITTGVAGNYQVTVTDGSGCTGTSSPVTVTVNPTINATITISSNAPSTIIASTTITFTATSTNGGNAPVYSWLKNGNPVGTNSLTYTGTGWNNGDVITCQMTSNAACVNPAVVTSNSITLNVQSLSPKYVISDITANKAFYYDASFVFLQSNTLSGTALNSVTNAADVFVTATHGYILDQTNKRIFRSSTPGSLPSVSRSLNTNTGTALSTPKGHCISGDTLWVLDQKDKAIYRYSLSACFTGTGTINAAAKLTLNTKNAAGEGLFSSGPYLYVLNNGTTKNLYRYLKSSGTNVLSRAMVNTTGTALSTVTGCALDGSIVNVVDAGLDRNLQYSLTSLFTGTGNLNATASFILQSTNLNSTGIALTNAILLRGPEENSSIELDEIRWTAYPNPTEGRIILKADGLISTANTVQVFDMAGRLIRSMEIPVSTDANSPDEITIDLSTEGSGLYLISIQNGTSRTTLRVVVK